MAVDMDKLNTFIGRFVGDLGAAVACGDGGNRRKARLVQGARYWAVESSRTSFKDPNR
jgi:hypothetical protein